MLQQKVAPVPAAVEDKFPVAAPALAFLNKTNIFGIVSEPRECFEGSSRSNYYFLEPQGQRNTIVKAGALGACESDSQILKKLKWHSAIILARSTKRRGILQATTIQVTRSTSAELKSCKAKEQPWRQAGSSGSVIKCNAF